MPLFVSEYVAVVDTVNSGVKEVMCKHLRELMADASTYGWEPGMSLLCCLAPRVGEWFAEYSRGRIMT